MATTDIINKLYENILENSGKSKKEPKLQKMISTDKNCCKAGVRYTTIGNAYRSMVNDNLEVWLIDEEKDGNIKTNAYSRCMKTMQGEHGYCHIHFNTFKNNSSAVKDFDKDILPKSADDKIRRLANISDPYFLPMGKRGAKKKSFEKTYTFPDEKHPVLLVMNHKDAKLNTILTLYAIQLLKNNPQDLPEIKKLSTSPPVKVKYINAFDQLNSNNLIDIMKQLKKTNDLVNESDKMHPIEFNYTQTDTHCEALSDAHSDAHSDHSDQSDAHSDTLSAISDEVIIEEDDIESVNCIPIYTKDKEELWYNLENNMVYRMSGDDGDGVELGLFKKVNKSNHFIVHEKKYYTIVTEIDSGYKCFFSGKMYDKDMNSEPL